MTIDGGGSRLVCRYRSGSASGESSDAFYLLDCEGVTVRRFVIDTDRPVNLAGRVEEIDREAGDDILAPHPAFHVTGDEALMMQDSYDDEGSFDGRISASVTAPTVFLLKNARQTVISYVTVHAAGEIPVIAVQACHDTADTGDAHVHRNICVRDHVFAGKSGRVVRIAATDGVVMEGNRLEHYTAVPGCAPYETPGCTGVSCVPVCGEEENGNILASNRD